MTSWRRNINSQTTLTSGYYWHDAIAAGNTYQRVHVRWGFSFDTPIEVDIQTLSGILVTFGLITDIGNGTEIPPGPQSGSSDPAPPTSRWIYWETRQPVIRAIDNAAGIIAWGDSGATEPTDTKGQVLAQGIPSGDTLNLFASWQSSQIWSNEGVNNTIIWNAVSILRKV